MKAKNGFAFHVNYNNFSEIPLPNDELSNLIPVFILCKYSFKNNPNIDIGKLVHNNLSSNEIILSTGEIRTNFTFKEIMSFKNAKIDFYIVDAKLLSKIFLNKAFNNKSNISFSQKNGQNILLFDNEFKLIKFESHHNSNDINNNNVNIMGFANVKKQTNEQLMNFNNNINNVNNQAMNNNNINYNNNFSYPSNNEQFVQLKANSNNSFYTPNAGISDNKKVLIMRSLILLYGMEKGIKTALINGVYDLRPYYLVNKTFIDKFKEKFQFNMINNISALSKYSKFSDFGQNIISLEALNDVKNISKLQ